jgi:transposase
MVLPNIKAAQRKYQVAVENGSKGGRPRLDIDMERVARLKQEGKTNEEIGRILGASKTTIQTRWTEYREKQSREQKPKNQEKKETETKKETESNLEIEKDIDIDTEKERDNFLSASAPRTAQIENNKVTYHAAPRK